MAVGGAFLSHPFYLAVLSYTSSTATMILADIWASVSIKMYDKIPLQILYSQKKLKSILGVFIWGNINISLNNLSRNRT